MQIDSATYYLFTKELTKLVVPSQVRQIHQIDNRIMDIELFCPNARAVHLVFNTHAPVVYLSTKGRKENSYAPSQTFCMTLRKHLEGSRLAKVEQVEMDRILAFSFDRIEAGGEIVTKTLYAELLPASPNLVLVEKGTIIDACLRGKKGERLLVPGETYALPENTQRMDFMKFSKDELKNILDYAKATDATVEKWIFATFNGFSRFLVDDLADSSNVPADTPLASLTDEQENRVLDAMISIKDEIEASTEIHIYKNSKGKPMVSPIALPFLGTEEKAEPILPWLAAEAESTGSLIAAQVMEYRKKLHTLIKREERKQKKITDEMKETRRTDQYKLWGTLLSIYTYIKLNGQTSLTVDNLFNDPPTPETIPIDPRLTVSQNSQVYFKKYNKMKTRLAIGQEKLEEAREKIDYLTEVLYFTDQVKNKKELDELKEELKNTGIEKLQSHGKQKPGKKKENKEPKLETTTIDGFRVYLGRNNTQNEYLTLHKAAKNDLWFHALKLPGSHVVIETNGETVPEETIAKAASLAAWNSKGRDSGKVDVDYTLIRYVKKIPNGPPGLVNYSHQHTLTVVPKDEKSEVRSQKSE